MAMADRHPAFLGGQPAFPEGLPFARPDLGDSHAAAAKLEAVLKTGMITNDREVRALEEEFAAAIAVKHCVAVSSATSGLILAAKCMGLTGEVILPSFSFVATGLPLVWNNLRPVFVDIDPQTFNVDPQLVERAITPKTSAIIGVHVYGNPADEDALADIAARHGLRLLFDAAHGIGSLYRGRPVGRAGDAQVFSLSPTKLATGAEGGLIATQDSDLADDLRLARNYGQAGDYICRFAGLNARLSELHATLARHTLAHVEENVARRNDLAERYRAGLAQIPGLSFPVVDARDRHSYKDFTVRVDAEQFGMERNTLRRALELEGIATKAYFDPPIHKQASLGLDMSSHRHPLPHTERAAAEVISLPLYPALGVVNAEEVVRVIRTIHAAVRGRIPLLNAD
jgi:dTDP-4-amino-4,6-dideoxygalactose transaminase